MPKFNWIVSQIGARQHYGVPRGFHYKDHLRLFYTELWCPWGGLVPRQAPAALRAYAGRYHSDLPRDRVVCFTRETLWERFREGRPANTEATYLSYARTGEAFARRVNRHLSRQTLDPAHDVFFGFNTGCLETLELLRERGIATIVDQIDPGKVEEDLVYEESLRWPGWQKTAGRIPDAYFERLRAEWAASDLVLVNSEWSKTALIAQGVPAGKLLVVPVAYEVTGEPPPPKPATPSVPLTVLWIGTVNLRKGIQYLVEAARLLARTSIRFVVAGPVEIAPEKIAAAPANMKFVGRLTRDQTDEWYRQADLFVLPTISDGFAITQIEAMARGLPVVTTPNCGQVVLHGIDGLIVPAFDAPALAEAIARLDADRPLLREMGQFALRKASTFHLPRQADQIENEVRRMMRPARARAALAGAAAAR